MFSSSNPNERGQIALKLSVCLNNMKPLIFNCFFALQSSEQRDDLRPKRAV